MNNKSINLKRTESLLMELIPEALSTLGDSRINSLPILEVDCKNGKYDARVYFDGSDLTPQELREVHKALKKANPIIKAYCLSSTGWYKCPNFTFIKDDMLETRNNLENLFQQISSKNNQDTQV